MLKIICITLLITPYISGHTYGIKTHLPAGLNDVQRHYRVEYSSPLTTATHTDSSQSSYSSQYSKSFKTDSNGNVILSSSDSGDLKNYQFNDANQLNAANNVPTSSFVVKHDSKRIGDNAVFDAFVDNTLNKNLQEHQNILENIQTTFGGNNRVVYEGTLGNVGSYGSEVGSTISHQGTLGESHQGSLGGSHHGSLGSTLNNQKSGSYASSVSLGNSRAFGSDLQSVSHHQDSSNLGSLINHRTDYGNTGLGTSISQGDIDRGSYASNNLGTKITHPNSRLETSNLEASISHSNNGYGSDKTIQSQGTAVYGSGLDSTVTHSTSTHGAELGTSISHQKTHPYGSDLVSSISYGANDLKSTDLGSSILHANNGYGLDKTIHSQGSGTYGGGFGTNILPQDSSSHGSNLGSSISYGNNKQMGDFGLNSNRAVFTGYGSDGSRTYDIYNGSGGSDLYQQHFSYVKSHKFSKCPPGVTGQFSIPDDCHKFLNCWQGDGHIQDCGAGTVFNEKIRGCDFPSGNSYSC